MLLDARVPLERAFPAPRGLVRRPGHEPAPDELAAFAPEALASRPAFALKFSKLTFQCQKIKRWFSGLLAFEHEPT